MKKLAAALLLLGCQRQTTTVTTPPVVDSGATVQVDAGPPPADVRAAALRDLDEGRKLSRAKDWSKALEAFDRALVVMPDDARILSEVGWAALQANRLDRAEEANSHALATAKEPLVRAPILYNVGRVAEERNRPEAARRAYRESLALRNNAEVKRRLEGVGTATRDVAPVGVELGLCRQSFPDVRALCRCLETDAKDELFVPTSTTFSCKRMSTGPLGDGRFGIVEAGGDILGERANLLIVYEIVHEAGRVRWLETVSSNFEPGAFGVHNQGSVFGGESRNVGGHTVVIIHSAQDDNDFNMAGLELCEYHAKLDTVCAFGEKPGETKCTRPIATEARSGCGPGVEPDPKDMDADMRETLRELKRRATSKSMKAEWAIAADGKVSVTINSGTPDLMGVATRSPPPLWK